MSLQLRQEERRILGSLFLANPPIDELEEILQPSDFTDDRHSALFEAVTQWFREDRHTPPEVVLVRALEADSRFGGPEYVSSLSDTAPSTLGVVGIAKRVREASRARELVSACRTAIDSITRGENLEESMAVVERAMVEACRPASDVPRSWAEVTQRSVQSVLDRHAAMERGEVVSLPLPFGDFAQRFVAESGELVILGARPGMGKSSLAMQIVEHCEDSGLPTCTFMLEMTELQTIARLGSSRLHASVSARDVSQGRLMRSVLSEWVNSAESMANWRGELWDDAGLTVEQIGRRARSAKRKLPDLALVVIDHLGKVAKSDRRMSTYDHTSYVSGYLKDLAKEIGVVVLALAQLNRGVEARPDKHPRLSDLRDSGKIEEDADSILMLYRGDYYEDGSEPGIAEVLVEKQRQGEAPLKHLMRWDARRFRFSEIEKRWTGSEIASERSW